LDELKQLFFFRPVSVVLGSVERYRLKKKRTYASKNLLFLAALSIESGGVAQSGMSGLRPDVEAGWWDTRTPFYYCSARTVDILPASC